MKLTLPCLFSSVLFLAAAICIFPLHAGEDMQKNSRKEVTLAYSGPAGTHLRRLSAPEATRFRLQKYTPAEISALLQKGALRIALTEERIASLPEGMTIRPYAAVGTILAVSPDNPLRDIRFDQAKSILEEGRGNWKMFGGPALRLNLYLKSSTDPRILAVDKKIHDHSQDAQITSPRTINEYRAFRNRLKKKKSLSEQTPGKEQKVLKLQTISDEKTFSLLFTDRWGIGVFPLTRFDETRVKLLSVNSIPPTLDNFKAASYPLMRSYYLVTPRTPTPEETFVISQLEDRKFLSTLLRHGFLIFPPAGR